MEKGCLIANNYQGHIKIVSIGNISAITEALVYAGKNDPGLSTAISAAAVELDNYSEALKTGDVLRKMIDKDENK